MSATFNVVMQCYAKYTIVKIWIAEVVFSIISAQLMKTIRQKRLWVVKNIWFIYKDMG